MRKILILSAIVLFGLQAYSQEIPEYCLENDAVHRYLTEVQYDPNDYSYSKIMDYCDPYPYDYMKYDGYRKDQPLPVPIKLTKVLDVTGTLYVSEKDDYSDALIKNIAKGTDSINVYNLIPGRIYNWKLEYKNAEGAIEVAQSGKFKTTGTLRMLKIDNIFNVRDMGGWTGLKGYPLKYGTIVRGSRLNVNGSTTKMITQDGINELRRVGMRAELDMRDASNSVNATHSFFGDDCPIYNVNQGYRSRIATFADGPQSIQGILKLIEWLKQGKPVYLHCSVGADRTGTVAYLVGALCGMSEDALCKEFELTSFSADKIENEADRGTYERLVRQRDYTGRLDKNDNNESYKFAKMVDKIKTFPGETLQEKVYWHLSTGVNGTKVSEADLKWLMNYMIDCFDLGVTSLDMERGDTYQINARISESKENPNPRITYSTSNEDIATVSEDGLITAIGGGKAVITAELDGFSSTVTVNIPLVEAVVPDSVVYNGMIYKVIGENLISNGSFEYGEHFANWTNALNTTMTTSEFDVVKHEDGESFYIQSRYDGGEQSAKSIRSQWKLKKNKTYVLGYRVKNSTDLKTEKNPNLVTSLTYYRQKIEGGGDDFVWGAPKEPELIFEYPSYDGNWTEVQYVFTNTESYEYCQVWFSHLSQNGNNTCFDNFYLVEVEAVGAGVGNIGNNPSTGKIYDLYGRSISQPSNGIIIIDGKKYLNR